MKLSYEGLFEDWEIAVAKNLVHEFRDTRPGLQREGFKDLLQECLIHWLSVRKNFAPGQEVSRTTFMGRVIRNKLTDIIREQKADKRRINYLASSIDRPLADDDDSDTLVDTIPDTNPDPILQIELKIELSRVLQKLTSEQCQLCCLLGEKGLSIKAVSERLKTPRTTIYDEIKRIRKIFAKSGLEDYLK